MPAYRGSVITFIVVRMETKIKCQPYQNPENPKHQKLNPKNPKLTGQNFLTSKIVKSCVNFEPNKSFTPPCSAPPSTPSPNPRADVQRPGVRKKRFERITLSNPAHLSTPYPPVYPLPYPKSRGTEASTR